MITPRPYDVTAGAFVCGTANGRRVWNPPAPNQLLGDHPLYGLDQAISDYLGPCLERQFGEPFRRWRAREDARTLAAVDATLHLAPAWIPLE